MVILESDIPYVTPSVDLLILSLEHHIYLLHNNENEKAVGYYSWLFVILWEWIWSPSRVMHQWWLTCCGWGLQLLWWVWWQSLHLVSHFTGGKLRYYYRQFCLLRNHWPLSNQKLQHSAQLKNLRKYYHQGVAESVFFLYSFSFGQPTLNWKEKNMDILCSRDDMKHILVV